MITLFAESGCQYCARAIAALDAHKLSFVKKNIADAAVSEELIAVGGKHQVPFLVDGDVKMYESDAIIAYLDKTYGGDASATPQVRVHKAGGACPA